MLNTENLESHITEASLPQRDILREAPVDAEAAPRRRISKTLIAASVISGLGIWQVIHLSNGGEPLLQISAKTKAGPIQPRSDRRTPPGRTLTSADPVGAYIERSKRGMTDQEIRWMLEDFQQMGPMPTSGRIEESRSFRERQNRWYLLAMEEALSLTPEQQRTVQKSMAEALDQAEDQFNYVAASGGRPSGIWIEQYLEATYWLRNAALAPWNVCVLTDGQSALTMERRWLERNHYKIPDKK